MPPNLTEDSISKSLAQTYAPGTIASAEGSMEMQAGVQLVCAAVLVPLIWWKETWHLVYTRRTQVVEHHKGQVSFPGGGCDVGESTPEQTALREAREEIGLKPEDVRLLGKLNEMFTITHYRVTPVVGVMPWPYEIHPEPAEVERVFTIPLDWLADAANWEERPVIPPGAKRSFPVIYYHPYGGEILWGATARMTHDFLSVLGLFERQTKK